MKTEEILGLVNVIFYIAHIVVFSVLGYRHNKKGGLKSAFLILIFLFVLFFVALQVGGFLAQFFFIGREMTTKLKALHDTIVITIATVIQSPIWFIFLKKKAKNGGETENSSIDSP
ncbi:MAG: hypothetical protein RMJ81_04915 [Candidatus Kryptonium sp.]|nr:hypothetical protein [Candidatus Kryptonium sp.]MCX7762168.1 hypothetical protein [Candidatus Kryptonium sp.]MDW8108982.1 hypothetical protein [Candidatus Kryptonium sp.]